MEKKSELVENSRKDEKDKNKKRIKNRTFSFGFGSEAQGIGLHKEPKKKLKLIRVPLNKMNLNNPPKRLTVGTLSLE